MKPLAFVVGAALALAAVTGATAQTYPSHPITMIVPSPAGGPTDTLARILAEHMKTSLGQPIIIENVSGAGGKHRRWRGWRAPPPTATRSASATGTRTSCYGATIEHSASTCCAI